MSDAVSRPSGSGRFNLNQDITRALDQLGKVEYSEVLRAHFPARNLTPGEYARLHPLKRRVKCVYVGPQDPVPTECPRGWDLLVLVGIGFTRRETEDVASSLESAATGERVVAGIPLQALPGSAQFKELAVLDHLADTETYRPEGTAREALMVRRASLRRSLLERLRKALAPAAFRWMHEGRILEEAPAGSRNAFFSGVLESLYPDTPRVPLAGSRRERQQALDELLDLSTPLQLPVASRSGGARVLRLLLADQGLLEVESDRGASVLYKVGGPLPAGRCVASAWNKVLEALVGFGDRNQTTPLVDLLADLARRPLGLRGELTPFLLGAALRRHYPDLELVEEGEPVPPSGVALRRALARPRTWHLRFHPTSEDEAVFLRALLERFGAAEQTPTPGGVNLWDLSRQTLMAWRERLPPLARGHRAWSDPDCHALMALLEDPDRTRSARDLLGTHLPVLFGEDGIPLTDRQQGLLARIDAARTGIEAFPERRQEELLRQMGRALGAEEAPDQGLEAWFESLLGNWRTSLHPGTDSRPFSEWASGLLEVAGASEPFAVRWFESLPRKLGLPAVRDWDPDQGAVFLARLARARLELELWRLRELFPLPQDPGQRSQEVRRWIREAMDGSGLDQAQRRSLMLDLLESLVWK
jgi:hypothetical protein